LFTSRSMTDIITSSLFKSCTIHIKYSKIFEYSRATLKESVYV
jgi:hypothetical protein